MADLTHSYKLARVNHDWDTWDDFKEGDYSLYSAHGDPDNKPIGIHFRCPGCGEVIAIDNGMYEPNSHPKWAINFETLTATPSILHSRDGRGCGWHGYLTNGVLVPC
jgi:hypothetical protein